MDDTVLVVAPDEAQGVLWAAEDLHALLERASGQSPRRAASIEKAPRAPLLLVGRAARNCPSLDAQGYALVPTEIEGRTALSLCGADLLGQQYAVYAYLHALGFRFFHPEQTYAPRLSRLPQGLPEGTSSDPTAPALGLRGFHLHTQHPLEMLEALLTDDPNEVERAQRYVDWLVRNRQNLLEWILLDSVSHEAFQAQAARVLDYAHRRGVTVYAQSSFTHAQQNAHRLIDQSDEVDDVQEVRLAIERLLEKPWDGFSFSLGASEFSETDDVATLAWLEEAAATAERVRPGTKVYAVNHVPAAPRAQSFGGNFFDLPRFASPAVGTFVHTVMFYALEGPAPVYGNADFSRQLAFLESEAARRDTLYYPESAWWLTFDNMLPLFLPVYLKTRYDDLKRVAEVPEVKGHVTFTSGGEWGYWLTDWVVAHQSWDPSVSLRKTLLDLFGPLSPHAGDLLVRMALDQQRWLIDEDLMPFLAGEDLLTEVGLKAGIVFHDLAPAPREVVRASPEALALLESRLGRLEQMCTGMRRYADAWRWLAGPGAAGFEPMLPRAGLGRARLPQHVRPELVLQELRDASLITALRCENAIANYRALTVARARSLGETRTEDPVLLVASAKAATAQAAAVVARREKAYRYEPTRSYAHQETDGDVALNLTDYPYRVQGRTHTLFFWHRRDRLVDEALAGDGRGLQVSPQQAPVPFEVTVDASAAGFTPGSPVQVRWDDGQAEALVAAEGARTARTFAQPGQHWVEVEGVAEGAPLLQRFSLSAASSLFLIPREEVHLTQPDSSMAAEALGSMLPNLQLGFEGGPDAAPLASLAQDVNGDGQVESGTVVHLPAGRRDGERLIFSPFSAVLPVETASGRLGTLTLRNASLSFARVDAPGAPAELRSGVLVADVVTQELVTLIAATGVLEPPGILEILAELFSFPAAAPPELLRVELAFEGAQR